MADGSLSARVAAACERFVAAAVDDELTAAVKEVRRGLDEPLRVAVAGRVNAGKSTLVNAVLRQRVAPTDVSECTRLVTWYRHGVPERVEVVDRDGGHRPLPLRADGTLPPELGAPSEEVDHLEVHLSNDALTDLVLIDTPGLASANAEYSRGTEDLLALDAASALAVSQADALVFVLTIGLHEDEAGALAAFRSSYEGFTASALNAIGVLNKADTCHDDPELAWPSARRLADRYAGALRSSVSLVVPLISLLAETVDSGRLTERHVDELRRLAELEPAALSSLLLSPDRFVTAPCPVSSPMRAELVELLDLYGVAQATSLLAQSTTTTSELLAHLRERSGIDRLRSLLLVTLPRRGDPLKASGALASLERVLFRLPRDDPRRTVLHDDIEEIRLDPAMHRLNELRAIQDVAARRAEVPPNLESELRRLFVDGPAAERLGAPPSTAAAELGAAAASKAAAWKRFGNDPRSGPAERRIADTAARTYELLWAELAEGSAR